MNLINMVNHVFADVRRDFIICRIMLPADLKNWDFKKKKDFVQHYHVIFFFLVSLEITLKIITLKHHSDLINYVKIVINRVHSLFFFAISKLKKLSGICITDVVRETAGK